MSNAGIYAHNEFVALRKMVPDAEILLFEREIVDLANKFGKSGQSGGSAFEVIAQIGTAINHLLSFKPLVPIIGSDDEWVDVTNKVPDSTEERILQNKRCGNLFINGNNGAHFLDAIVWREGEIGFTGWVEGISSMQYVKGFPFAPRTYYVDVEKVFIVEEVSQEDDFNVDEQGNKFYWKIVNRRQLDDVFEYFAKPAGYANQEIQDNAEQIKEESSLVSEDHSSGAEDDQGQGLQ